jgi:hypothetical protein
VRNLLLTGLAGATLPANAQRGGNPAAAEAIKHDTPSARSAFRA